MKTRTGGGSRDTLERAGVKRSIVREAGISVGSPNPRIQLVRNGRADLVASARAESTPHTRYKSLSEIHSVPGAGAEACRANTGMICCRLPVAFVRA